MIIGDPARFAIEYELAPDHLGGWLRGRIRYWCGGIGVGDFEHSTYLCDALGVERSVYDAGKRANPALAPLSAEEILTAYTIAFFGFPRAPTAAEEQRILDEQWARHVIDPQNDVFGGTTLFLVENETGRLLFRDHRGGPAREIVLRIGEVDEVLRQFCTSLGAVWERERARAGG